MPGQRVIEIKGLWKSFDGQDVLRGIDLDVLESETMVVLGPSGCGKSVLLKHIIGLMTPDRGSVLIEGSDVTKMELRELNKVRKNIGMVFQGAALFDSMSAGENVALPMREHRRMKGAERDRIVQEKLALVGLTDVTDVMPPQLSGGMKKRVALARAIALDPEIILYDEPTTGLDPVMAEQINELIRDLQRKLKTTSVVVTHDLHSARFIGDKVALMEEGTIAFIGTPDELESTTNEAVRNFIARGHAGLTDAGRSLNWGRRGSNL